MSEGVPYTIVDAFTSAPFQGNPAAVMLLDTPSLASLGDPSLQRIAREFNLSETAFLMPTESKTCFGLRWFTPAKEVPMCGHATLASASVLFARPEHADAAALEFDTLWGRLVARRAGASGRLELEFPAGHAEPVGEELHARAVEVLHRAFGQAEGTINVNFVGRGTEGASAEMILVEIDTAFTLEGASVDPSIFSALPTIMTLVTQRSTRPGEHFVSRAFAPTVGIGEDPVTGSAHCLLAPYWFTRLGLSPGTELAARQVGPRIGDVRVLCDKEGGTCKVRGDARTAARGEMFL